MRDDQGNFLKAKTALFQGFPTPRVAEAWALYQSINWFKELNLHNAIFEVNCKSVAVNFEKRTTGLSEYYSILQGCRFPFSHISTSKVNFVKRQVTHYSAKALRFYASPHEFNYISTCIVTHIMNEMQ